MLNKEVTTAAETAAAEKPVATVPAPTQNVKDEKPVAKAKKQAAKPAVAVSEMVITVNDLTGTPMRYVINQIKLQAAFAAVAPFKGAVLKKGLETSMGKLDSDTFTAFNLAMEWLRIAVEKYGLESRKGIFTGRVADSETLKTLKSNAFTALKKVFEVIGPFDGFTMHCNDSVLQFAVECALNAAGAGKSPAMMEATGDLTAAKRALRIARENEKTTNEKLMELAKTVADCQSIVDALKNTEWQYYTISTGRGLTPFTTAFVAALIEDLNGIEFKTVAERQKLAKKLNEARKKSANK